MGLNRRLFLVSLGSSGVLVACGGGGGTTPPVPSGGGTPTPKPTGSATPTPTASPTPTPAPAATPAIYIDLRNTNLPAGTNVYAYIVGDINGSTYWWIDANGMPHEMDQKDTTTSPRGQAAGTFPNSNALSASTVSAIAATYPSDWADYSIPLTLGANNGITLSGITAANMPGLGTGANAFSARLYLSVGVPKLPFSPTGSPATGYTAPGMQSGTPGSLVLYDFFEFAFDSNQQLNGDTSIVDEFGLPMTVMATGSLQPGSTVPFGVSASRSTMMATLSGLSMISGYSQPQIGPTTAPAYPANAGSYLRILSPKQLVADYGGSLNSYFTNISTWYANWTATPLVTYDTSTGYYSGMVVGGVLTFKQGNYATAAAWQAASSTGFFTIGSSGAQISSSDIIQCNGTLSQATTAAKNVAKMIGAAFNRGTLSYSLTDDSSQCPAATSYYQTAPFNEWAAVMHQNSISNLAYGFPYDDVCNQSTDIDFKPLTTLTITLGNF